MMKAVKEADIVISATGCKDIVKREHLGALKDGCILGNSGHFDNEISKRSLEGYAGNPRKVREFIDEYSFPDGRKAYLLCEGRLMNLGAGQGHPVEIMDMSFSIQALSLEYLTLNYREMKPAVYNVPAEIDDHVARLKLKTMGTKIDTLTAEQRKYLSGWQEGT
jgi:adenosylhomocysteinase